MLLLALQGVLLHTSWAFDSSSLEVIQPEALVGLDSGSSIAYEIKDAAKSIESERQNRINDTISSENKEDAGAEQKKDNPVSKFIGNTIHDLTDPDKREGMLANLWHWDTTNKEKNKSSAFYDTIEGNKYSHSIRLFEWNSKTTPLEKFFNTNQKDGTDGSFNIIKTLEDLFKFEFSLDFFGGLQFGDNPWNSPEVYRSNVQDYKATVSVNLTNVNKIQIANFARFGIEFELVPILLGLQSEIYTTTTLNDNCFQFSGMIEFFRLDVTLTKNFAQCSNNLHKHLVEATSWTDLLNTIIDKNLLLLFDIECEFDEIEGTSTQHIDMLSFNLWPQANGQSYWFNQCAGGIPYISEQFSSQYTLPNEDDYDFDYEERIYSDYI